MGCADPRLIDRTILTAACNVRSEQFVEEFGYFVEDGHKAIDQIEQATKGGNAHGVVRPAQGLKNDARALGALPLAALAGEIEAAGYAAVKAYAPVSGIDTQVAALRPLFSATSEALRAEIQGHSPLRRVVNLGLKVRAAR